MDFLSGGIIFISGLGAGAITGLIGASAVTFMAGILVTFLGYPAYTAIGISLATDVFASSSSTIIYKKHGNIYLKKGLFMALFAIIFSFIGAYFSRNMPDFTLGKIIILITIVVGLDLIRKPLNIQFVKAKTFKFYSFFRERPIFSSIFFGSIIGLISGIFGAGGGLTILGVLTIILGIRFKKAVGTAVLIMTFIALAGTIGHFIHVPFPTFEIAIASVGAIIGAIITTLFANKKDEKKVSIIAGIMLLLTGVIILIENYFFNIIKNLLN
jgi:hypothetical protein